MRIVEDMYTTTTIANVETFIIMAYKCCFIVFLLAKKQYHSPTFFTVDLLTIINAFQRALKDRNLPSFIHLANTTMILRDTCPSLQIT